MTFYDGNQNIFSDLAAWAPPFAMEPFVLDGTVPSKQLRMLI